MKPHDMERFFWQLEGALSKGMWPDIVFKAAGDGRWSPMTDIYETDEETVIKMDLAGVQKDEISIIVEGNRLIVRGMRKDESKTYEPQKKKNFIQMEINYGEFERVFLLRDGIEGRPVRAEYTSGFLRIIVARKPKQKLSVPITFSEGGQ